MAKDKKQPAQSALFPETNEIISLLAKESAQDIVVLLIPSHDKQNVSLPKAQMAEWTQNGMQLLADLYGGATAYETFAGIFKTDDGHYLRDKPLLLESFATIAAIHDPERLEQLVNFSKRMGKTLEQDTIMLIFGTVSYSGV